MVLLSVFFALLSALAKSATFVFKTGTELQYVVQNNQNVTVSLPF